MVYLINHYGADAIVELPKNIIILYLGKSVGLCIEILCVIINK